MTVTGKVVKVETKLNSGIERFTDRYVNLLASISTLIYAIGVILILTAIVLAIVMAISNAKQLLHL